jgi:RNA polymerase sigma-70 factor (ECF subfamily)
MEMTKNAARQWVEGNDGVFSDLFRSNCSDVFWAACRILGDRAAAEDVVQETFLRLYRMRSRVDPTRPLRPLLLKIASNCAVDMLRRRRPEEDWEEQIHSGRGAEPVQTAIGDGQGHEVIADELGNLPSQYRVVLILRYGHDLSYKELASVLDVSVGAVTQRLRRAKELLRKRLVEAER